MSSVALAPDTLIAERFRIQRAIGEGGMGTVWRATDEHNGVDVALKVLQSSNAAEITRMHREATLLAELRHPGIVRFVALGEIEPGTPFIAMEWVEGKTLAEVLAAGPLPVARAIEIIGQAARALQAAHARGIVHRDLKPQNLLLVSEGAAQAEKVKLIDFGIAQQATRFQTLTKTGYLIGTPGYMAPEQARGGHRLQPATDVFALGCVLYECLSGRTPFASEHLMGVLAKILFEESTPLEELVPSVPARLAALVARMLRKDPAERPATAGVVADELLAIGDDAPAAAPARPAARHLTNQEQRLLSVVLAANRSSVASEGRDTMLQAPSEASRTAIGKLLQPLSARAEPLADGSLVVTIEGKDSATDMAAQAARCALGLRALLPDVPMALASGRTVVGQAGALGRLVDGAAEILLHAAARPGGAVAIDDRTAGLLDARFVVRGDAAGLYLWGEQSIETTRTLLGKPTKTVGRDRELYSLAATFAESSTESVARVVLVTGPSGIGKSRVRYEFLRHVRDSEPNATILLGRGDSTTRAAPFSLIADAVRRLCGIEQGEALFAQQTRLRARLARSLPDDQLLQTSVFLGELIGVTFDASLYPPLASARRSASVLADQMQRAWEDWLIAETKQAPVVIVLEDLHWADLSSITLLDHCLRNLREQPLLVLGLGRPELHENFPALWQERELQEIRLLALTKRACERMIDETLTGQITEELRAKLVAQADGNPLFLEELIRHVASGHDTALPETIVGMIESRLASLPAMARRVLRAGSVFGERFWVGGAAALTGQPRESILAEVDELVDRELLSRRPTSTILDEAELAFRNTAVRQTSYTTLTEDDRRLGHLLAAEWLEARLQGSGESSAVLAEHFERGGLPARAATWFAVAAEQALAGHDLSTVIKHASRAIAAAPGDAEAGRAQLLAGAAFMWMGQYDDAAKAALAALAQLRRDDAAWFGAVSLLVETRLRQTLLPLSYAFVDEAAQQPPTDTTISPQVECVARAALACLLSGLIEDGRRIGRSVEELVAHGRPVDAGAMGRVHEFRAMVGYVDGDLFDNLHHLEAASRAFGEAGDARSACQTQVYLGFALTEMGQLARARQTLESASKAAERLGLRHVAANALHNLGYALALQGDLAGARKVELRSLRAFEALGDLRKIGHAHWYLGKIELRDERPEVALREIEAAIPLLEKSDRRELLLVQPTRVDALIALGRTAEALAVSTEALATFRAGNTSGGELDVLVAHAEALIAVSRRDEARALIDEAEARLTATLGRLAQTGTFNESLRRNYILHVPVVRRALELHEQLRSP